jgi:hypothetical protein
MEENPRDLGLDLTIGIEAEVRNTLLASAPRLADIDATLQVLRVSHPVRDNDDVIVRE